MRREQEEQPLWRRAWYGICKEGGFGYSEVGESGGVEGRVEDVEGFWWGEVRGRRQGFKDLDGR